MSQDLPSFQENQVLRIMLALEWRGQCDRSPALRSTRSCKQRTGEPAEPWEPGASTLRSPSPSTAELCSTARAGVWFTAKRGSSAQLAPGRALRLKFVDLVKRQYGQNAEKLLQVQRAPGHLPFGSGRC